jgi:hypothetical protein
MVDNIKVVENVDWIELAEYRLQWQAFMNMMKNLLRSMVAS